MAADVDEQYMVQFLKYKKHPEAIMEIETVVIFQVAAQSVRVQRWVKGVLFEYLYLFTEIFFDTWRHLLERPLETSTWVNGQHGANDR